MLDTFWSVPAAAGPLWRDGLPATVMTLLLTWQRRQVHASYAQQTLMK